MTITAEQTTSTEVAPEVAAAFQAFEQSWEQTDPAVVLAALLHLVAIAEAHDTPLCQWGRSCNTPHDITIRESCCGDAVCGDHEDEHDAHCKPFEAHLLEERF